MPKAQAIIVRCLFAVCVALPATAQNSFQVRLADSALVLTKQQVVYDPSYYRIAYPNGDVPAGKGVCTDVVIRAYRMLGIDLQKAVHEDMKAAFAQYPQNWGMSKPDPNIDHRRVPNLMTFFGRHGTVVPITRDAQAYQSGDVVCWNLGGGITHIGIVSRKRSADGQRPLIVHNIGAGQVLEDCLFKFTIIGHYRYGKE
ncbi:MAG: DUF1287 domain-containing protein [Flavobacteriales bacterium]|nr:DUF1287 domain-containing protein [Flavobacteriales bacterium]MEB2341731.1 DUF1287 domain-containing protein [Flavobacteriia bacterium]